jgi:hypothetical protein
VTVYLPSREAAAARCAACLEAVEVLVGAADPRLHAVSAAAEARAGALLLLEEPLLLDGYFARHADSMIHALGPPPFIANLDGGMRALLLRGAGLLEEASAFLALQGAAWADPFVAFAANASVPIAHVAGVADKWDLPALGSAARGGCPLPRREDPSGAAIAAVGVGLFVLLWLVWATLVRAMLEKPRKLRSV